MVTASRPLRVHSLEPQRIRPGSLLQFRSSSAGCGGRLWLSIWTRATIDVEQLSGDQRA